MCDFCQLGFGYFPCAKFNLADRKKMEFYRGFGCIYAHENDFLQKKQGFGYELDFRILYLKYKKSKTQKTGVKLKFFS